VTANIPDVTMLAAMVDDIPPVRTPSGRRRHRPGKLDADKGYDSARARSGSLHSCCWRVSSFAQPALTSQQGRNGV
jgi:hypothetical protein